MESHHPIVMSRPRTLRMDDAIPLARLWHAIWQRRLAIVLLVLVVTLATALVLPFTTPVYQASAVVLVDDKKPKVVSFDPETGARGEDTKFLDTQVELLKSRSLAEQVVRKLDLVHSPEFNQSHFSIVAWFKSLAIKFGLAKQPPPATADETFAAITQEFMDTVDVQAQGKSQLIHVDVQMRDPQAATVAANAVAYGFIDRQLNTSITTATDAGSWLSGRLQELGDKLKDSEGRLQAYREAQHLVDVDGVDTISASEMSLTSSSLTDAMRDRAQAQSQYQQVQGSNGSWERASTLPAVMSDPVVQKFKAARAVAQAKVDQLTGRYGADHPAMLAARSDLTAATSDLKSQVEQVVAGIERNYQLAVANQAAVQASFDANKNQLQDISRKQFQLQGLQREVDSNQELYNTFQNRLKQNAATSGLSPDTLRVVDAATQPLNPIKPKKTLIVMAAAVAALVIGSLIAIILEFSGNIFRSADEIERRLRVPVLGVVPLLSSKGSDQPSMMFANNSNSMFSEAIRGVRTGVLLDSSSGSGQQVILITSSIPGEGKTTLAANLAQAIGAMERVLLVDADLRRSSLAKVLDLPPKSPGLTDLINGTATLAQCVHTVHGVDVLCSGTYSNHPLELLASPHFAEVMEMLKSQYTRIIIDSPPTQAVSDAKVLSTHADSLLYIVKSSTTKIPLVQKGVEQLIAAHAPVRGIVINQVDTTKVAWPGRRRDSFVDYYG